MFFTDRDASRQVRCNSLSRAELTPRETGSVRRMMDVTRASLYFAKGLILVEGVCEALLLPALAKRLGRDLAKHHVAVVPLCGVAFETFKQLPGPAAFGVETAIVTDADPPIPEKSKQPWNELVPEAGSRRSVRPLGADEEAPQVVQRAPDRSGVPFCSSP